MPSWAIKSSRKQDHQLGYFVVFLFPNSTWLAMIVGEDSYFGLFVMFHFLSIANVNQTNGVKVESRVEIMILILHISRSGISSSLSTLIARVDWNFTWVLSHVLLIKCKTCEMHAVLLGKPVSGIDLNCKLRAPCSCLRLLNVLESRPWHYNSLFNV